MDKLGRFDIQKMVKFLNEMDIMTNPEPAAIFDPLLQGFNAWAIPSDHPGGDWHKVADKMDAGSYTKRSAYVGTAYYMWNDGCMHLTTDAYALRDHLPEYRERNGKSIHNRPDDIDWLKDKVIWVFAQIGLECPPFRVGEDD
jgi:hypothetical protein